MLRELVLGCVGLIASFAAVAQAGGEGEFDAVVERYVAEGLRSNLALQGESLEVERAAQALAAARARFFPEVSLQGRYTRAEGGREFTIPLGTTLNPVYTTLNELLAAQGQPAPFPQISDATVQFLREEEQDTRVVVRQPLYAPAIPAAVRAQRALLGASSYNRMAVARALRRDVTIAYLDWLKARSSVQIVAASQVLLRENLRVNESLFDNGKITEDQVLRAKAELLAVEQQQRETENLATQARSFFNFLLNRDLLAEIESSAPPQFPTGQEGALEQLWSSALNRRPEVARVGRAAQGRRRTGSNRTQTEVADAVVGRRCRHARRRVPLRRRLQLRHCIARFHVAAVRWRRRPGTRARGARSANARSCCDRKKSRSRSASKSSKRSIA